MCQFFFIHIPKCGGTTLEYFFENVGFKSFLAPKDYRDVRGFLKVPPAHFDMTILEKLFRMDSMYSFAAVRCPYRRMLSDFKWAKTKTNNTAYFENMSFDEFCNLIDPDFRCFLACLVLSLWYRFHYRPPSNLLNLITEF